MFCGLAALAASEFFSLLEPENFTEWHVFQVVLGEFSLQAPINLGAWGESFTSHAYSGGMLLHCKEASPSLVVAMPFQYLLSYR